MSGSTTRALQYWDSCVLISWRADNQDRTHEEGQGILAAAEQVDTGAAHMLMSVIGIAEILISKATAEQNAKLGEFLKGTRVSRANVDSRIAERACRLRDDAEARTLGGEVLSLPDAIHLATAMLYKADVFFTFDKDLLALTGKACVGGLQICKPPVRQMLLDMKAAPTVVPDALQPGAPDTDQVAQALPPGTPDLPVPARSETPAEDLHNPEVAPDDRPHEDDVEDSRPPTA